MADLVYARDRQGYRFRVSRVDAANWGLTIEEPAAVEPEAVSAEPTEPPRARRSRGRSRSGG